MKPTIIYVSGAPGSGKTTLAKLLSEQLYISHISSDLIKGGLEFTQSIADRQAVIQDVFVPLLVNYAEKGISIVVDHVLQKDIAKSSIIDKLTDVANVIYIHTETKDPIGRFVERNENSQIPDIIRRRQLLRDRVEHHRENLVSTARAIDLGVPTMVVNTDDGYEPALEKVVAFINKQLLQTT